MKNHFSKNLLVPRLYALPVRLALSYWRLTWLRLMVWWHAGDCRLGRSLRINHPVVFQGRGQLRLFDHVTLGYELAGGLSDPILLQPREVDAVIAIRQHASIMNGCELIARSGIDIGENCRIGPRTIIYDADFHGILPSERADPGTTRPVSLMENVWVGSRATILKGVVIGRDAVVAAGSVVVKSVEAGAIVAGNPARVVGSVYRRDV
jgi:acetyltransferase-like isoleucine patch superfamily enzyme